MVEWRYDLAYICCNIAPIRRPYRRDVWRISDAAAAWLICQAMQQSSGRRATVMLLDCTTGEKLNADCREWLGVAHSSSERAGSAWANPNHRHLPNLPQRCSASAQRHFGRNEGAGRQQGHG